MIFDQKVPLSLKKEQLWFGAIIGRPIDTSSRMNPVSPNGRPMELEAAEHIIPSPTLQPAERVQIYNQQYWWRLINAMHDLFPVCTRFFGYHRFNEIIGIPYLTTYPPRHWSLTLIGDRLVEWIKEEYQFDDKELVLNACRLDWAYAESFFAPSYPPLTNEQIPAKEGIEALSSKKLCLQPYIKLFHFPYDLLTYRETFLAQSPDYWREQQLPTLDQNNASCYILYRNRNHDISWQTLSFSEFCLLNQFQNGLTIDELCEWLEDQEEELCNDAMVHLQSWLQEWIKKQWLSLGNLPVPKKPWECLLS